VKHAIIDGPVPTGGEAAQRRLLNRLRRLEGQVRGLQRMVEEGRSCRDVLTLLSSVRSALDATGDVILEHYAERCAVEFDRGDETVRELVEAVRLARG
jgi:CsoR family transcriptional regulator, copper-sensing transcriptional repressor